MTDSKTAPALIDDHALDAAVGGFSYDTLDHVSAGPEGPEPNSAWNREHVFHLRHGDV